jgi:DNA-binding HxlR family transcriptional regulator
LDLLGDRWTLLVVRDLLLGKTRYKDFAASPEGIPTNILAERLARLCAAGLAVRVPAEPGGRHLAYKLTAKGRALTPTLRSLRDWGLKWQPGTRAMLGGD